MFSAILILLLIILIGIIEIVVPALSFAIPMLAVALDLYVGFIIIRWFVETIGSYERRRKKKRKN